MVALLPRSAPDATLEQLFGSDGIEKLPTGLGAEVVGGTPAQFAAHIKSEIAKRAKVIKDANVELQ